MKALVTGAAGFVGSHMYAELERRGYDVTGLDIRAYIPSDLLHYVRSANDAVYDLVVHCAYHVGGRVAIDGQPQLLARNVELDACLFDWALRTKQRRVLYFSSSAAYPVTLQSRDYAARLVESDIDLDHVDSPDARYGWAKLNGEQLARAAAEAGLTVHVVRPFSGYSEDQSFHYPFPSIIDRALADEFSVWGPPGQTRDWIHISDVVAGALAVVDADLRQPVNLCTGLGTEMGQLMRLVAQSAGKGDVRVEYQPDRPTGVMYRVGDPTLMHSVYAHKVSIDEGVRLALH